MIYLILACVFLAGAILGYALDRWWHERPFKIDEPIPNVILVHPKTFEAMRMHAATSQATPDWEPEWNRKYREAADGLSKALHDAMLPAIERGNRAIQAISEALEKQFRGPDR